MLIMHLVRATFPGFAPVAAALLAVTLFTHPRCAEKKDSETEPNNSFSMANALTLGRPMAGYIDSADDRDFFFFKIQEPVIADISLSGIKGVNHSIHLWRGGETPILLKIADDNRKSSPERLRNIHLDPGDYFVSVQHGDRDQKNENRETPYILTVEDRFSVAEEREPNDSPLDANPIPLNSEITGFYSPAYNRMNLDRENQFREEDWFSFRLDESHEGPRIVKVTVSGVPGIRGELSLIDSQGRVIYHAESPGPGMDSMIANVGITQPGIYYLRLCARGFASNNDIPYVLALATAEFDPAEEFEINDFFEKANVITGNSIRGTIGSATDRDCFLFMSERPGQYRLQVTPGGSLDLRVLIHSRDRRPLFELNNFGPGQSEIFANLPVDDALYLTILAPDMAGNEDPSYTCTLEPLNAGGPM
jgi:hypothetical protein